MKYACAFILLALLACNDRSDKGTVPATHVAPDTAIANPPPPVQQTPLLLPDLPEMNAAWERLRISGVRVLCIGTEPFWSLQLLKGDTLSFQKAEWEAPLLLPAQYRRTGDTVLFTAKGINATMVRQACSDGMSDRQYSYGITIRYERDTLRGCAVVYGRL